MKQYSLTETAQEVRKALKAAFPKTTFSVRTKRYAGGCSIWVTWTDGPTWSQVNPILNSFERCGFDGMQDLKTYNEPSIHNGEMVHWGADYVQGQRTESAELTKQAAFAVAFECDLPLLEVDERGNVKGGNYSVPFCMFEKDGQPAIAHDSHRGEYYNNLVHQWARKTSTEKTHTVKLPDYINQRFIDQTVKALIA